MHDMDDELTRRELLQLAAAAAAASALPFRADAAESSGTAAPVMSKVSFEINGKLHALELDTRTTLLDALRDHLHFTGTKKGCDHGQCGACTVIAGGRRINSCLTLAVMHEGDRITTIEGLGTPDKMHPMQAAFVKHDGYQCGYCTPGTDLLRGRGARGDQGRHPQPCQRRPARTAAAHQRRVARAHERQHLPLRRVFEHRRGHHRSRRGAAHENLHVRTREVSGRSRGRRGAHQGRAFHRRRHQPARSHETRDRDPGASHRRQWPGAGQDRGDERRRPAHRRAGAQHRSRRARKSCAASIRCCRARCWPAPRGSCATRRPPPAISCSARAARISTTPTCPATNAIPAAAAARWKASAASTPSSVSSDACIATHPSDMAVAMRALDATVETVRPNGAARQIPIAKFHRLPGDYTACRDHAAAGRADHRRHAAQARRRHAALLQGARSRVVCLRAGVGGAHSAGDGSGRVALGGVAHKPWRVEGAERALPRGAKAVTDGPARRRQAHALTTHSS